jgi:phage FluMu gp28-like protein
MTDAPETVDPLDPPVISRDPAQLPGELPRGAEIPEDLDPLAEGVLMKHQREWLEDTSDLKIAEKGRRAGITFAEALDDTLIAASARSAGGDNVFYIGDTKDKGREFIGYVAHFARVVAKQLVDVEEFLFEDEREDGTSKFISAYRVKFASGFRVEALSSRPENIRGLQGVVVIDEAAFHKDVRAVIDAVNALLIWGGKIRIISSHNGMLNAFNELIGEAKKADPPTWRVHFIPFSLAVENGLYRRVCLMRGWTYTPEGEQAWEAKIRGAYGSRIAKMQQELDAIPADAEGAALSRVVIEQVTDRAIPVIRYQLPNSFNQASQELQKAMVLEWCRNTLGPVLAALDKRRRHDFGFDFARTGDASAMVINELGQDLVRRGKLTIELRNVPFEMQREILYFVGDRLPRFGHGALDATGNGAYLAEKAGHKWGNRVSQIKLSQEWYRLNGTPYIEAFGDRTVVIAGDDDVIRDHQALQYVGGVVKVPDDFRYKGSDGLDRHGDTGIGGMLAWYASRQGAVEYEYQPVKQPSEQDRWNGADDDDDDARDPWRSPLGAALRGSAL